MCIRCVQDRVDYVMDSWEEVTPPLHMLREDDKPLLENPPAGTKWQLFCVDDYIHGRYLITFQPER